MRPRLAAPSLPWEIPPETPLAPPARGEIFAPREKFFPLIPNPLRGSPGKFSPRGLAVRRGRATFAFAFGSGRGAEEEGWARGRGVRWGMAMRGPGGPGAGRPGRRRDRRESSRDDHIQGRV